ncbi:MAG: CcmD family protein [Flavobacterium sp.]|nr:MAG: CcmD family protein [Flavobacterium sp.]
MKKISSTLLMLLLTVNIFAQDNNVEMADAMRSDGKIYVVVAVILIILIGLLVYLFALDRRLKMLEKKTSAKN